MVDSLDKMIGHFEDMDIAALNKLINAAHEQRTKKLREAREILRTEIIKKIADLDITVEEFFSIKPAIRGKSANVSPSKGEKAAVKYLGPNGESWSGRGRLPRWLVTLEVNGGNRDEYKVAK